MERSIDIYKSAGIIISDRKLLVTRSAGKSVFIAPGGKREPGETSAETLQRELSEELQIATNIDNLKDFGTFYAPAAGQDDKYLQMDVFLVTKFSGEIAPAHEVEEIMWIDSATAGTIELGSIFAHDVVPKLVEMGLID